MPSARDQGRLRQGHPPAAPRDCSARRWVGKDADRPVYKVDIGTLVELRNHERQAAEELEQWKIRTVVEAEVAVTPAAVALSQLFTTEQLKELERKILEAQEKPA